MSNTDKNNQSIPTLNPLAFEVAYHTWLHLRSSAREVIAEEDSVVAQGEIKLALQQQLPTSDDVFADPSGALSYFKGAVKRTREAGFASLEVSGLVPAKVNKDGVVTNILSADFLPVGEFAEFCRTWDESTKAWKNSKEGQKSMKDCTKRVIDNHAFRMTNTRVKISDKSVSCTFSGSFNLTPEVKSLADSGLAVLGLG